MRAFCLLLVCTATAAPATSDYLPQLALGYETEEADADGCVTHEGVKWCPQADGTAAVPTPAPTPGSYESDITVSQAIETVWMSGDPCPNGNAAREGTEIDDCSDVMLDDIKKDRLFAPNVDHTAHTTETMSGEEVDFKISADILNLKASGEDIQSTRRNDEGFGAMLAGVGIIGAVVLVVVARKTESTPAATDLQQTIENL
jgi:hypothetical protein